MVCVADLPLVEIDEVLGLNVVGDHDHAIFCRDLLDMVFIKFRVLDLGEPQ